ncbi:MAG: iron-containing alcohol dehydrogenase family protein [Promethearchaeota archaeon]
MEITEINFNLISPKIIFGTGRIDELGSEIKSILKYKKIENPLAFLVTGGSSLKKAGNLEQIIKILEEKNISKELYDKAIREPTTHIINQGKEIVIEKKCDIIIGIGGGSVMDTAKGIAGLATNGGIVEEYLAGKEFIQPALPFILIPTTSGTGSEVTNNSVIKNKQTGLKKSIRGLWANLALLDPELTLSLPKKYTAYSGADALVQAIESLVSKSANFISDFFARKSIELLGENLPLVYDDLSNIGLREKMMLGSLLGAISFANGKLGAVHGFAHPIGIKHDIAHGLICGLLLPHVMRFNIEIDTVVKAYSWIARLFHKQKILTDHGSCSKVLPKELKGQAEWAIEKLKDIFEYINIPLHLSDVGISKEHLNDIVKDTTGSSLENNPRETDKKQLMQILINAL